MTTTTAADINPGAVLRIANYLGNQHSLVRVLPGTITCKVYAEGGPEYAIFHGVRVRPSDTNVSFGEFRVFSERLERIEVIKEA